MKKIVQIKRVEQYVNKLRKIGIYINNQKVDTIRDGETKSFELDTDENEIYVKIDWCKTKPLKIENEENETIKLELGSNLSGWRLLLGIYYITFKTSEYLYLKKKR